MLDFGDNVKREFQLKMDELNECYKNLNTYELQVELDSIKLKEEILKKLKGLVKKCDDEKYVMSVFEEVLKIIDLDYNRLKENFNYITYRIFMDTIDEFYELLFKCSIDYSFSIKFSKYIRTKKYNLDEMYEELFGTEMLILKNNIFNIGNMYAKNNSYLNSISFKYLLISLLTNIIETVNEIIFQNNKSQNLILKCYLNEIFVYLNKF